jgi:hypothetical protein
LASRERHGPRRSSQPTNRDALAPAIAPVFPIVAMQDECGTVSSRERPFCPIDGLPSAIREDGVRIVEHLGAPIPMDLSVGLDTTPSETAALPIAKASRFSCRPLMRWMTDFATAVHVGWRLDIPLAADCRSHPRAAHRRSAA